MNEPFFSQEPLSLVMSRKQHCIPPPPRSSSAKFHRIWVGFAPLWSDYSLFLPVQVQKNHCLSSECPTNPRPLAAINFEVTRDDTNRITVICIFSSACFQSFSLPNSLGVGSRFLTRKSNFSSVVQRQAAVNRYQWRIKLLLTWRLSFIARSRARAHAATAAICRCKPGVSAQ